MMRTMRGIAPWIMLIVAVSFVAWMVFEFGMDISGQGSQFADEIARVNGQKIDRQRFYAAVQRAQEQQRQAGGPALSLDEQRQLEDAVLEQLVQEMLLQEEYKRRRIRVTDDEVSDAMLNAPPPEITQVPEFQTEGRFDLAKYQRYLRSGADPQLVFALEARYREELPRFRFLERVTAEVYVSDAELWRIYRDRADSVTARVVTLVPAVVVPDDSVRLSDQEVAAYYRANQDAFRRPQRVFLSFVSLSRVPNAADSAAARERVEAIRQELRRGADFAEVAQRESGDSVTRPNGGDLGPARRGDFVPAFEDAALALRPGQLSDPVLTQFGYHLIKLESKSADGYHPRHILIPIRLGAPHLEEVDARADSLDILAAEQTVPSALDTVAARMRLPIDQAALFQGDQLRLGTRPVPDVGLWAFESLPGETSPVIEAPWAYYVFRLDSIAPATVPPLSAIRDEVVAAASRARRWELTRERAARIADHLRRGRSLADAARAEGQQGRTIGPFARVPLQPVLQDAPQAIGAAFGLPVGTAGGPYEGERAIFFVEPIAQVPADSAAFVADLEAFRQQVLQQARQARVNAIMASLRERANVVDRRSDLARLEREAADQPGLPPGATNPLGFGGRR